MISNCYFLLSFADIINFKIYIKLSESVSKIVDYWDIKPLNNENDNFILIRWL